MPKPPKNTDATHASRTSVELKPNRCAMPARDAADHPVGLRSREPLTHTEGDPGPTKAITSGRPAATTEPKAISSTTAAPRNPIPSGLGAACAR
jgi:hypothetical protein